MEGRATGSADGLHLGPLGHVVTTHTTLIALALLCSMGCLPRATPAPARLPAGPASNEAALPAASPAATVDDAVCPPNPAGVAERQPPPGNRSSPAMEPPRAPGFPERASIEALDCLGQVLTVRHEGAAAVVTLPSDDLFEPGSAQLKSGALLRLDGVVSALSKQTGRDVVIRAYTDSLGSATEATRLSAYRATAVLEYFAQRGIPLDMLRAEGLGPAHPVASNRAPWIARPTAGSRS